MKGFVAMSALVALLAPVAATSPISKILDLMSGLESKLGEEKGAAIKTFNEFSEWCEDQAKNLEYSIKTGKGEVEGLKATIEEQTGLATSLASKIDELSASLATDESDLKAATEIRAKESGHFATEEKELQEVIDTLERAVGVIQRELNKGKGASALLQGRFSTVAQALGAIVDASVLSAADSSRLTSLVQSSQGQADGSAEDSLELGAPAAAVYESHSGGIISTIEDLSEKAQVQLAEARKAEMTALHNFEMLKQGLEDEIKFATKDTAQAKKSLSESGEKKAVAEGDLSETSKNLAADKTGLANLNQDCMTKAEEHEAADKSRAEELEAIAVAKKAISENTSGAASDSYGFSQAPSLLQVARSSLSSRADLVNFEAVRFVRDLARKHGGDRALAQLASRMAAATHADRSGDDPFTKIRALVSEMIEKLESEAGADATEKAFCDKELSESNAKKADQSEDIEKITFKLDQLKARSEKLKGQITATSKALAELAASRAEMTKMRQEEHAAFVTTKADMEQGIKGVKLALKVLRDYYAKEKAHEAAVGAGGGIIGLLEVCESDFTKGLAEDVSTEGAAAQAYEQEEKENEIEKVTKEKDVEYKNKEVTKVDKTISEATTDRVQMQTELDAVMEYLTKLEEQCIAKPETYADKTAQREAEIAGLKEALKILEGEAVSLLQSQERRALRGVRPHRA